MKVGNRNGGAFRPIQLVGLGSVEDPHIDGGVGFECAVLCLGVQIDQRTKFQSDNFGYSQVE